MKENKGCLLIFIEMLKNNPEKKENENYPYEKTNLATNTELSFYQVLRRSIGNEYTIMTKVRLEDIIKVKKGTQNYMSYRGKIKSRHIDFLLCDPTTLFIYYAIELDDKSHERKKEQDEFKNNALNEAGIKLIRIPVKSEYNIQEIKNLFP